MVLTSSSDKVAPCTRIPLQKTLQKAVGPLPGGLRRLRLQTQFRRSAVPGVQRPNATRMSLFAHLVLKLRCYLFLKRKVCEETVP